MIFHSYVKLPEGKHQVIGDLRWFFSDVGWFFLRFWMILRSCETWGWRKSNSYDVIIKKLGSLKNHHPQLVVTWSLGWRDGGLSYHLNMGFLTIEIWWLVGGFKHEWIIFHVIWMDVIRNPWTNSIIFQRGRLKPPTSYEIFSHGPWWMARLVVCIPCAVGLESFFGPVAEDLCGEWLVNLSHAHQAENKDDLLWFIHDAPVFPFSGLVLPGC